MTTTTQMLALTTAAVAGAFSAANWIKARSVAARRSSLAGICSSLAIIFAVASGLVGPQPRWLHSGASELSIALSIATFGVIIRSSFERGATR
jgi:hypothetical protein